MMLTDVQCAKYRMVKHRTARPKKKRLIIVFFKIEVIQGDFKGILVTISDNDTYFY